VKADAMTPRIDALGKRLMTQPGSACQWELMACHSTEGMDVRAWAETIVRTFNQHGKEEPHVCKFHFKCELGQLVSWKNKPNVGEQRAIAESNGCFWETFVLEADAFLTYNVNNSLGLANGSPVSMHSMSFSSVDKSNSLESDSRVARTSGTLGGLG
jgi:hypothetical protein